MHFRNYLSSFLVANKLNLLVASEIALVQLSQTSVFIELEKRMSDDELLSKMKSYICRKLDQDSDPNAMKAIISDPNAMKAIISEYMHMKGDDYR